MGSFSKRVRDHTAWLELNVPDRPVNVITRSVREELRALLNDSAADPEIHSMILISRKEDHFMAGADVEEFARLRTRHQALMLVREGQDLVNMLEASAKPIVAAIHGACLGGGLEAVLACEYRIATKHHKTVFQLPEVRLGILPAAGGCQLLPRLIGLRRALEMILTGRKTVAADALRYGLVDELVHPSIVDDVAFKASQRLASGWRPKRHVSIPEKLAVDRNVPARNTILGRARKNVVAKKGSNYPAPLAAIAAIGHGLQYGVEAGLEHDAASFSELAIGDVSRNLVRLFFADKALKKAYAPEGGFPEPKHVRNIAVVGGGFIGSAIAGVAASHACVDVRIRDTSTEIVTSALERARNIGLRRSGAAPAPGLAERDLEVLISGGADWAGFGRVDLVIEATTEDLETKRYVFEQVESHVHPGCVIASTTSTLRIAEIAAAIENPHRVLGMHFCSPVEKTPLVEVVAHEKSDPAAIATAAAFARRMKKTAIVVRDSAGFWVNRLLAPYLRETWLLLEAGAGPRQLDSEMTAYGFPVGPVTLLDEIGLDVVLDTSHSLYEAIGERLKPRAGLARMVGEGRLGRKSGRGLYEYRRGKRRHPDANALELIRGSNPWDSEAIDISERLIYAILNEAARAFSEEVVGCARDGDVGAVLGFGFPPFLGGPLRHTDRLGVANVVDKLDELQRSYGDQFEPAQLLVEMAGLNEQFHHQKHQ